MADAESGPRIATPEEVEAALTGLIKADRARLMSYARWRIDGLGRAALGRKAKDLFGEAVTATLAGNRRWQPDSVDIKGFLLGVMRSISSHWRDEFDEQEPLLESELPSDPPEREGERDPPLEQAGSSAPSAERVLIAGQMVATLKNHFREDPEVLLVMGGIKDGMSGPEIQEVLELSQKQYETIMRRLRRGARKLLGPWGGA